MIYIIDKYAYSPANANDLNLTIITSANGDLDILQDGEDNDIDFDIQSMNSFDIDLTQIGDDNTIDIDVNGRTSNGSSMSITQTGDNKSYTGSFYCGGSSCSMTVNQ
jgi:hypothetical protein